MLVTCPECGLKISEEAETCPGCGLPDAGMLSKEWCERYVQQCNGKYIETWCYECTSSVKNPYSKPRTKVRIKADIEKLDIGYRVIFLFSCPECGIREKFPPHATHRSKWEWAK